MISKQQKSIRIPRYYIKDEKQIVDNLHKPKNIIWKNKKEQHISFQDVASYVRIFTINYFICYITKDVR